jgi:accessory gene regulator B
LAPVDNPSKPINKEEKKKRMKKGSFIILSVYLIIVISTILLYVNFEKATFLIYALCLSGGIAWQVFTLTKSGHLALNKIDAFINYIIKLKKEVKIP